jgi:hypothetical protein
MSVITAPICLSESGPVIVLDETPENEYRIDVDLPDQLIPVCFGQDARTPTAKFSHPNLAARANRIHNFKHDRARNGSRWTTRPGVDLWFLIPKSAITILPEKGYSYVRGTIGGVKVSFNVSGGTGNPGWADRLSGRLHVRVGHSKTDLGKVAAIAVRDEAAEAALNKHIAAAPLDAGEQALFDLAIAAPTVGRALAERFQAGDKDLKVHLIKGYSTGIPSDPSVGTLLDISFARIVKWRKPTAKELEEQPKVTRFGEHGYSLRAKYYAVHFPSGRTKVFAAHIDWVKTAEANGIPLS